jgi:D-lactate dehydrogenase (cytochrome)
MRPGIRALSTDVCVPISRLAECVTQSQRDLKESRLIAPIVGHVGDGNFHMLLLIDHNDADEVDRAKAFLERLVDRALAMDGTCTGEHGIGQGKMKYMPAEHGEPALDVMRAIKRALDPLDILNPGKIFGL